MNPSSLNHLPLPPQNPELNDEAVVVQAQQFQEAVHIDPSMPFSPINEVPTDVNASQGRFRSMAEGVSARYNAWVDQTLERNPNMERGRLSVITGAVGGLAVLGAIKFGPQFAEHVISTFGDKPTAADVAATSITTGVAFAGGMNYFGRRRARVK